MNEEKRNNMYPVTVIGAANMDISGFSSRPVNMADSNPGHVEYYPGGVGRNIAENLLRIGADVRLVSVFGDDPSAQRLIDHSKSIGLDIGGSVFLSGASSSVYIALMDSNGEMRLALSDMSILERLSPRDLEERADLIAKSSAILADAGLSGETLDFIPRRFTGSPIYLDPVSSRKAEKVRSFVGAFHTLKLSRMEASTLSGIELPPPEAISRQAIKPCDKMEFSGAVSKTLRKGLEAAGAHFIRQGSKRVFITLGKTGVYFRSPADEFFYPIRQATPVNTTGGGDAFMAGIIYGTVHGMEDRELLPFAAAMGAITVQSKMTVSPEMNLELVQQRIRAQSE
ncbi:MAG: PfkB family carbohydrate kinase [Treponema sp.]|jgi:pseudouridine kinase|nr:PfkB family carbohydrate kinase [Treponema sp.]